MTREESIQFIDKCIEEIKNLPADKLDEYRRAYDVMNRTENNEIYYIVGIKGERISNLESTTINKSFCGKIINITEESAFFELNGSGAKVIIPTDWIEYLAPSKVLWGRRKIKFHDIDK